MSAPRDTGHVLKDDTRVVAFTAREPDAPAEVFEQAARWLREHPCGVVGVCLVYDRDSDGVYQLQVVGTFDENDVIPVPDEGDDRG